MVFGIHYVVFTLARTFLCAKSILCLCLRKVVQGGTWAMPLLDASFDEDLEMTDGNERAPMGSFLLED